MVLQSNPDDDGLLFIVANAFWQDTSIGTSTDIDGKFSILFSKDNSKLIISYVGFKSNTLTVTFIALFLHYLQQT